MKTDPTPEVSAECRARQIHSIACGCSGRADCTALVGLIAHNIKVAEHAAYASGKKDRQEKLDEQVAQAVYNHLALTEIGAALVGKITPETKREIAEGICKQFRTIRALDLED